MPHTSSTPPLDASGAFAWRLLEILSRRRPSVQEELANERLDKARDLTMRNGALISPHDLAIAKEKIMLWVGTTFIKYIKVVLNIPQLYGHQGGAGKRGISRFIQAREYNKAAKDL